MFVRLLFGRVNLAAGKRGAWLFLFLCLFGGAASGGVLDGGVDPENLGKGDWIYFLGSATNHLGGHILAVHDIPSLMSFYKSEGFQFLVVKAGTGATNFNGGFRTPQFDSNLVYQAHQAGLRIFGYTRSWGRDIAGEIALADRVNRLGADGFVIDAEHEWESSQPWIRNSGALLARELCAGIKARWPNRFLAHAPMPIISNHPSFPYAEFGHFCDAVMPQVYWADLKHPPAYTVKWVNLVWSEFYSQLAMTDTNAIKPIAPVGETDTPIINAAHVIEFIKALKSGAGCPWPGGYCGCSFWRADVRSGGAWMAVCTNIVGSPSTNPPVLWNLTARNATNRTVIIDWVTDLRSDALVEYGVSNQYSGSFTNPVAEYHHSIALSGLAGGVAYHYRVGSQAAGTQRSWSEDQLFATEPEPLMVELKSPTVFSNAPLLNVIAPDPLFGQPMEAAKLGVLNSESNEVPEIRLGP